MNASILQELVLPVPPPPHQQRVGSLVNAIDKVRASAGEALAILTSLRVNLLADLLSGERRIPESYDRLLEAL